MPSPTLPQPFSLFLDVDGTLIDIAPRPDAVVVPANLKDSLAALMTKLGGAVALVSGRSIADLDRLFVPLNLPASGVHGAEMRYERGGAVESTAATRLPPDLLAALQRLVHRFPGTLLEDKRYTAAVHYRAVPELGAEVRQALSDLIEAANLPDLTILPGHMVFEVKRMGFDKGDAIGRLMARPPFMGRTPVFLGDDVTDEPGFAKVSSLSGLAFAVGGERGSVPSPFSSPAQVRAWLAHLAEKQR